MDKVSAPALDQLLNFQGKTVLVTGAAKGIGAGIVQRFAEAGADLWIHYRSSAAQAEALAERLKAGGTSVELCTGDLGKAEDVEALFQTVQQKVGALDVLVNNAGIYPLSEIRGMAHEEWSQVIDANLRSVALTTQAVVPLMEKGGSIINIASIEATAPAHAHSHYCAAKAGVVMHTRCAALELGPEIRVNAVSPGLIWYPELESLWPEGVARYKAAAPMSRLGRAEDVADACIYLASPAARFVTGTNLVVDGGVSATPSF